MPPAYPHPHPTPPHPTPPLTTTATMRVPLHRNVARRQMESLRQALRWELAPVITGSPVAAGLCVASPPLLVLKGCLVVPAACPVTELTNSWKRGRAAAAGGGGGHRPEFSLRGRPAAGFVRMCSHACRLTST